MFEDVTLKVRGSDEAVLDSYTQFVRRAANTLNLEVSGKYVIDHMTHNLNIRLKLVHP